MHRLITAAIFTVASVSAPLVAHADDDHDRAEHSQQQHPQQSDEHEHGNSAGNIGRGIVQGVFGNPNVGPGSQGRPYDDDRGGSYGSPYGRGPYGGGPYAPDNGYDRGPQYVPRGGYGPDRGDWERGDERNWNHGGRYGDDRGWRPDMERNESGGWR